MIRSQPMDAVVVIGGCDKTLPAQVMAIASTNLPAVVVPTGPWWSAIMEAKSWAHVPIAGDFGANTAPEQSTP